MTTEQFIKESAKISEKQEEYLDFYNLAEKYGFCTPWCRCGEDLEGCSLVG